jgi:hypothetical protein
MERRQGAAEPDIAFIRDGFSALAFVVPPLWLLWHRLWLEALATFAVLLSTGALERFGGMAPAASIVSLLVSMFVGLEGNGLRIAALARRGWIPRGVIEAGRLDEAELRYAEDTDTDPAPAAPHPIVPSPVPVVTAGTQPVGLLLNPGR